MVCMFQFGRANPFLMVEESLESDLLKHKYEGYIMDLVEAVSDAAGLDYTLNDKSTNYNSLIQDLIDNKTDLAVADMTISEERMDIIDFSLPFMTVGLTAIMKKPSIKDPSLFSFLSPFSANIWVFILAAYVAVSFLLTAVSRTGQQEPFSFGYSLWFNVASLLGQGVERLPQSFSSRLVTLSWWLFIFLMVSSYTANLAAFLTVDRMVNPIKSLESLVQQDKIKYGVAKYGSSWTFLNNSKIAPYN